MLFGRDHPRDGEWRQELAPVRDALDFEPDHGELVDDRRKRRVGVKVLLEPSEGELHHCADSGAIASPICRRGVAGGASRAWTSRMGSVQRLDYKDLHRKTSTGQFF